MFSFGFLRKKKFPYYIVRFKQEEEEKKICIHQEFPYYIVRFKLFCERLVCLCDFLFPYYIVRFKQKPLVLCRILFSVFPYYIVRFKRNVNIFSYVMKYGFHTTQYDLNDILPSRGTRISKFPYYIVRFKLQSHFAILFYSILFPYYIVRFKPDREAKFMIVRHVSILHSTI